MQVEPGALPQGLQLRVVNAVCQSLRPMYPLQVELGALPQDLRLRAVDAVLMWQDQRADMEASVAEDVEDTKARVSTS